MIPNFHDGHFNGFRLGADKSLELFLKASDGQFYTLVLEGVQALTLSDIKQGNIIFELAIRGPQDISSLDIAEVYGPEIEATVSKNLLDSAREKGLHVLELNPSYGARGAVLFATYEIEGKL